MTQSSRSVPHPTVVGRPCSAAAALSLVGEKWALLAIREIMFGNRRFDGIARNTGAPRDRLAARLRSLEEAGVLERRAYSEHPPRFEYHLTDAGRDLAPVLQALRDWGDRWTTDDPPAVFVHHGDHDLAAMAACRTCGEEVVPGDLRLRPAHGWDRHGPVEES